MPRIARMVIPDQKAVYHVMSRTALDGFSFKDVEKDKFICIINYFSRIYFVDMLGFAIMGNHIHLLVQMNPERNYSDEDIQKRYAMLYGKDAVPAC